MKKADLCLPILNIQPNYLQSFLEKSNLKKAWKGKHWWYIDGKSERDVTSGDISVIWSV